MRKTDSITKLFEIASLCGPVAALCSHLVSFLHLFVAELCLWLCSFIFTSTARCISAVLFIISSLFHHHFIVALSLFVCFAAGFLWLCLQSHCVSQFSFGVFDVFCVSLVILSFSSLCSSLLQHLCLSGTSSASEPCGLCAEGLWTIHFKHTAYIKLCVWLLCFHIIIIVLNP